MSSETPTAKGETTMNVSAEGRKHEEAEFHDRLRALYEQDPDRYAYFTSNKKFYSVVETSRAFQRSWLVANSAGKRFLEYGCGTGTYAISVAPVAASVTGIDISPEAIRLSEEAARQSGVAEKANFVVMDAENLTFPEGSFDVVSVSGVLHHLDLNEALRQIHRVLAPGGKAIFMEALANNPLIHAYRKRTPHLRTAWEMEHILRAESVETMRELFRTVDVRYFHLAVLAAVPLRETVLFRPVLAVLDAVDRVVLRIPGVQRLAWMGCFIVADPR